MYGLGGVGGRGGRWKKYVKYVRAKWEVGPLETYISVQGGRGGGGSKITKLERTYFLNDPFIRLSRNLISSTQKF